MAAATEKPALSADSAAQRAAAETEAWRLIQQLRRAGFTLSFTGETLHVAPSSRLDLLQRQALKQHKPQILDLLRSEARPAPQPLPLTWQAMPPATAAPVCCGDCRHSAAIPDSDPVYGWRFCGLGIEGGGGFARQDRQCRRFEAVSAETPADSGQHDPAG